MIPVATFTPRPRAADAVIFTWHLPTVTPLASIFAPMAMTPPQQRTPRLLRRAWLSCRPRRARGLPRRPASSAHGSTAASPNCLRTRVSIRLTVS